MKPFLLLTSLFCTLITQAQHQMQKLWETDTTLAIPESVLPDPQKGILYVALIDGSPWEQDGKGAIGQVGMDGKIINDKWVTGLNAPKGMGIWKDRLYVADVTEVAVINIGTGKKESSIAPEGAVNLNDITIDGKGVVYVSDSKTGSVFRIENGKATTYLTGLNGVNGLKVTANSLYILTSKEIYKAGADKKLQKVGELEHGGDGIEPVGNGDFVVTSWSGYIYYLDKNGNKESLLDTHEQHKNTADIGYDPAKKIVYVPTFFGKSVAAYSLK